VFAGKEGGKMKKMLIESCNDCPDARVCNQMFRDCPLPDEPEKVKGKICIESCNYPELDEIKYDWWIDLGDIIVEGLYRFDTHSSSDEAHADAMEWAKKLGVEVEG
jgi:hypothetical protein